MRHRLRIAGLAALMGLVAGVSASPASAQEFGVRIGPDRSRVIERRMYREPRIIERRIVRPAPRRTVCTRRIRETVTPSGRVIRRPVEVCRTRTF